MSHFIEFPVDGLAGRKDTYAKKLNRDTNIFFGSNGSGKTSLLKILHSAMANDSDILTNVPFKKAKVKLFSVSYNETFDQVMKTTPVQPTTIPAPDSFLLVDTSKPSGWKQVPKEPTIQGLADTYLPISRLYSGLTARPQHYVYSTQLSAIGSLTGYSEKDLDERFEESLKKIWTSYAANISKAVREAQQKGLANILRAVLSPTTSKEAKSGARLQKTLTAEYPRFLLGSQGCQISWGPRLNLPPNTRGTEISETLSGTSKR